MKESVRDLSDITLHLIPYIYIFLLPVLKEKLFDTHFTQLECVETEESLIQFIEEGKFTLENE